MPPAVAPARARKPAPARRGPKILVALVAGESVDAIADKEGLSRKRIETILRDELRRRWVAPIEDYARLQIVRLEAMSAKLAAKAERGDLPAIDRMLKILDRLDRYHGFTRLTPAVATNTKARTNVCWPRSTARRRACSASPSRFMTARNRMREASRGPRSRREGSRRRAQAHRQIRRSSRARAGGARAPARHAHAEGELRAFPRLGVLGAARADAAARRLGLLADPGRPRGRQDAHRRRGGARMDQDFRHRQPHRRDPRRRARDHGARRVRTDGDLPSGGAAALRARLRPPRLAQRRRLAIVLGRGARPAARQAVFGAGVQSLSTCAVYTYVPAGAGVADPIAAQLVGGMPLDLGFVNLTPALADDFGTVGPSVVLGALDLGTA